MPVTIICAYCGRAFTASPYVALYPRPCCSRPCAYAIRTTDPIKRFWSKVDKSAGPDGCWPWLAGKDKDGYGRFSPTHKPYIRAHRFAYILTHEPIPADLDVLHKCDFRSCCNPRHFFTGTQIDNDLDRDRKGRTAHGEHSSRAKLKPIDVLFIRERFTYGASVIALAAMMGVNRSSVYAIVRRKSWKHL
jgi:hypothetical protein